jgi:hypothetical protein
MAVLHEETDPGEDSQSDFAVHAEDTTLPGKGARIRKHPLYY